MPLHLAIFHFSYAWLLLLARKCSRECRRLGQFFTNGGFWLLPVQLLQAQHDSMNHANAEYRIRELSLGCRAPGGSCEQQSHLQYGTHQCVPRASVFLPQLCIMEAKALLP